MSDLRTDFRQSPIQDQAIQVLIYLQQRDKPALQKHLSLANTDAINDLSFARLALSIPPQHHDVIKMAFPDTACPDAIVRNLGWKAFMAHELSAPYKINSKQRTM